LAGLRQEENIILWSNVLLVELVYPPRAKKRGHLYLYYNNAKSEQWQCKWSNMKEIDITKVHEILNEFIPGKLEVHNKPADDT